MSTIGDQYILGVGRSDHDRLHVISEIHDGDTRELLKRAGLSAGHRFVEFGCGLGYVSRWAAELGAHATGIDLNEHQVEVAQRMADEAGLKTARFQVANVYEHGLEPESVDVTHCRWLLVHLNRPVDAMRSIYAALKPGGVMVCEECDASAIYSEPPSLAYQEFVELGLNAGKRRGADYCGGKRAHLWAREAGFEIVHVNAYQPHYISGKHKGFWNWTMVTAGEGMVREGTLSEERLRELERGMSAADMDPHTVVAHARMHQLIARKPA
jgi:cyclopropane fatty-acyl-phospholipid synthase-like methyltransferase